MKREEISFLSSDQKTTIKGFRMIPDGDVKAVLQITHGMVEFIDRYEEFAKYLCQKGYVVTGHDHLGHGSSINSKEDFGYFAEDEGNQKVLEDIHTLTLITKELFSDAPYFLLGHSMGSFYARQYLIDYSYELDGCIISGTGHQSKAIVKFGMDFSSLMAKFKGWRYRSKLINNLGFGGFNKKFEPARTKYDWLTKDEKIVDAYASDERCTFIFTLNAYYNMFKGIYRLHDKNNLAKVKKDLPLLFIAGSDDPVGEFTKGVIKAMDSLKEVGVKNIDHIFYENDRHEILNETDREKVYEDIYNWLEAHRH